MNEANNLQTPTQPSLVIANVSGSACKRHNPHKLGYMQWVDWVENKIKRGAKQKQCPKCGRWYFKCEY